MQDLILPILAIGGFILWIITASCLMDLMHKYNALYKKYISLQNSYNIENRVIMKVKQFIYFSSSNTDYVNGVINVPGLGEVKIDNCLSEETIKRALGDVEAALRIKLGQTLEIKNDSSDK